MGIHLGRVGHIGIHVSDVDRSINFYRRVLGLKITGRWGPPDFRRPICFMRINEMRQTSNLECFPTTAPAFFGST